MVQGAALNNASTVAPCLNPLVKLLTIQRHAGEKVNITRTELNPIQK